jgi:F-type H+-transporting ATPase subunit c
MAVEGMVIAKAAAFLGAAFAMGIGALAPAYGQGLIGSKACENIGKYPESADKIRTAMFLSMGIIETSAIYALLVSLGLCYLGYIS